MMVKGKCLQESDGETGYAGAKECNQTFTSHHEHKSSQTELKYMT